MPTPREPALLESRTTPRMIAADASVSHTLQRAVAFRASRCPNLIDCAGAPFVCSVRGVLDHAQGTRERLPKGTAMDVEPVDHEPLEHLARTDTSQDPRALRRDIARRLLDLARGERPLERASQPGDLAAAFLRRYDNRRSTQEAYARDLSDWFVWLDGAGVRPFDATLTTAESYARQALPSGKAPAPATVARRMACLSAFYRRVTYDGHIARNPFELADRRRFPSRPRPPA